MKMQSRVRIMKRQIRNGRNFPKGFHAKSKSKSNPPRASARPLPAVGFLRNGFWFGSSYASPTGSPSASSLVRMVIENIRIPLSSPGLFACQHCT